MLRYVDYIVYQLQLRCLLKWTAEGNHMRDESTGPDEQNHSLLPSFNDMYQLMWYAHQDIVVYRECVGWWRFQWMIDRDNRIMQRNWWVLLMMLLFNQGNSSTRNRILVLSPWSFCDIMNSHNNRFICTVCDQAYIYQKSYISHWSNIHRWWDTAITRTTNEDNDYKCRQRLHLRTLIYFHIRARLVW
jgi:hypothetical protein